MRRFVTFGLAIAAAGAWAFTVRATPSSGFAATTLAKASFGSLNIQNSVKIPNADEWKARLRTEGVSDLYVQSNAWAPGGTTGWHTHPGFSLIIVTAGAVTVYDGSDSTCTPHVYSAGMGFVDPGGSHVHTIRNEGTVEADTIAVQMVPGGSTRRIDRAANPYCGF